MVFKPPTAAVLSMEAAVETPLIQTSMHAVKPCSFYFCFFFAFYFREFSPSFFLHDKVVHTYPHTSAQQFILPFRNDAYMSFQSPSPRTHPPIASL